MSGRIDPRALLGVAVGGFAGTLARLGLSLAYDEAAHLPWGTLAANAAGCLLLGLLTGRWQATGEPAGQAGERWRLALGGGFLGSFTTFSAVAVMLPSAATAVPGLGGAVVPGSALPATVLGAPAAQDPVSLLPVLAWTLGMALVCCLLAGAGLALGGRQGARARRAQRAPSAPPSRSGGHRPPGRGR